MANKPIKDTIHAKGFDIGIYTTDYENEFISLTDIARYKSDMPHDVVKNWMRSRETIEFLGIWESLHNPNFKQVEFDMFNKNEIRKHLEVKIFDLKIGKDILWLKRRKM